jgi:L-aspartate oxidase
VKRADVLILGSGIAGLATAIQLAQNPRRQIILLTRSGDLHDSNTFWAQGGIIHRGPGDSAELLVEDILAAGAGASLPEAAKILAAEGPQLLEEVLIRDAGVQFDRDPGGSLAYSQEAAHSRRRILHVGDATGTAISNGLVALLKRYPNIEVLSDATAVDLVTYPHHSRDPLDSYRPIACHGAYVFDRKGKAIHRTLAGFTVLATGGLGRIYRNTTNPAGARGDGIAMAWRAGARILNAEYVQFHPTALAVPGAQGFLISEAVRGEGGILLDPEGRRPFMEKYSPEWKDLAPRDVVARAIHAEMEMRGSSYVLLDIASHMSAEALKSRFPTIYGECMRVGLDVTREPIPVVPAAHYMCGGVAVDENGQSSIANLFAVGEASCTGLHGANRLASTSLLEGLVWGWRAARKIEETLEAGAPRIPGREDVPPWDESGLTEVSDPALIQGDMQTIQNIMWHYVGLVRSGDRLARAIRELRHLQNEIETFYQNTKLSDGLIGLRNAVQVSLIVAQAAYHNRQSRGCHYRVDAVEVGDRLL